MEAGFPLVDHGIALLRELNPKADVSQAKPIFQEFVAGRITYEEASKKFQIIFTDGSPLDRLRDIMACEKDQIPGSPNDSFAALPNSRKKTRAWSHYEDSRLFMGVYKYGLDNWTMVASFVGSGRNRSQCSQRWLRGIDPRVSKHAWTYDEEQRLIHLVSIYGEKSWRKVATELTNRSDVQCRYHFSQLVRPSSFACGQQDEKESDGNEKKVDVEKAPTAERTIPLASVILIEDPEVDIPIDAPIPLSSTFRGFKSDSLFDSSFWNI